MYRYGSKVSTVGSENFREIENDYKCQRLSTVGKYDKVLITKECFVVNADFRRTYAFAFL